MCKDTLVMCNSEIFISKSISLAWLSNKSLFMDVFFRSTNLLKKLKIVFEEIGKVYEYKI